MIQNTLIEKIASSRREGPATLKHSNTRGTQMHKEYDFSGSIRNPYARKLKKAISIRIDPDTITYFKKLAEETGIPYQNLMNHYLAECASKGLKPSLVWEKHRVLSSQDSR
jgi:predicted DNA binding CopG/RHH family protein